MIKVKNLEEFKEKAQKLIAYLDKGENLYVIKQKEPELVKWYYSYMPLTYSLENEARELFHEIHIKRHNISRAETALRISETRKNTKAKASKQKDIEQANNNL